MTIVRTEPCGCTVGGLGTRQYPYHILRCPACAAAIEKAKGGILMHGPEAEYVVQDWGTIVAEVQAPRIAAAIWEDLDGGERDWVRLGRVSQPVYTAAIDAYRERTGMEPRPAFVHEFADALRCCAIADGGLR